MGVDDDDDEDDDDDDDEGVFFKIWYNVSYTKDEQETKEQALIFQDGTCVDDRIHQSIHRKECNSESIHHHRPHPSIHFQSNAPMNSCALEANQISKRNTGPLWMLHGAVHTGVIPRDGFDDL